MLIRGFQSGLKGFLDAVGGVSGSADGIYFFIEGFFDGEAVPRLQETRVGNPLEETGRLVVVEQAHLNDLAVVVQGDLQGHGTIETFDVIHNG